MTQRSDLNAQYRRADGTLDLPPAPERAVVECTQCGHPQAVHYWDDDDDRNCSVSGCICWEAGYSQ